MYELLTSGARKAWWWLLFLPPRLVENRIYDWINTKIDGQSALLSKWGAILNFGVGLFGAIALVGFGGSLMLVVWKQWRMQAPQKIPADTGANNHAPVAGQQIGGIGNTQNNTQNNYNGPPKGDVLRTKEMYSSVQTVATRSRQAPDGFKAHLNLDNVGRLSLILHTKDSVLFGLARSPIIRQTAPKSGSVYETGNVKLKTSWQGVEVSDFALMTVGDGAHFEFSKSSTGKTSHDVHVEGRVFKVKLLSISDIENDVSPGIDYEFSIIEQSQ
jgi:hypothetical protein